MRGLAMLALALTYMSAPEYQPPSIEVRVMQVFAAIAIMFGGIFLSVIASSMFPSETKRGTDLH